MDKPANHQPTEVLHMQDGHNHVVGVKSLRVMLTNDGSGWFAQGLEIDYMACGQSLQEVKQNFSDGLRKTVHEHLSMHGDIEKLLQIAPQEDWQAYLHAEPDSLKSLYSTISFHQVLGEEPQDELPSMPFDEIAFYGSQNCATA